MCLGRPRRVFAPFAHKLRNWVLTYSSPLFLRGIFGRHHTSGWDFQLHYQRMEKYIFSNILCRAGLRIIENGCGSYGLQLFGPFGQRGTHVSSKGRLQTLTMCLI